jgi:flavin reductase (DIM6/NTAB) family NADH-FMN oxidoreductase RutF
MEIQLDSAGMKSDPRELRRAMGRFATGVTVVTTRTPSGRLEGLTANSFSSVSLDPPLVLWSLRQEARSMPAFMAAKWFVVHILGAHQHHLSNHFATPAAEKFADIHFADGLGGCPLLGETIARFECSAFNHVPAGDHTIFIGRVERLTHRDGEPLIYSGGRYCQPVPLN